jgi:hypothetical protein
MELIVNKNRGRIDLEGELTWCDLGPSQPVENLVKIH